MNYPSSLFRAGLLVASVLICTKLSAVIIVAHRGASYDAPENTLASNKLAWEQQADRVETDIHMTKDGKIIVSHDKTTKRTTGRDHLISELTFEELRKLDAGSWKDPKYAGEKMPTLEEQFALIPPGKHFLIEIKVGPEIIPELVRCIKAAKLSEKTISFLSFNLESLKAIHAAFPTYRTLFLADYKKPATGKSETGKPDSKAKKQPTIDELVAMARAEGFSGLSISHKWPLTAEKVASIKAAGLEIHAWTMDDVETAQRWIALGALSITTNRPGWMREQLAKAPAATK